MIEKAVAFCMLRVSVVHLTAVSTHELFNYTILTPTSDCSPVLVSCWSFQSVFSSCQFLYRLSQSEAEFAQQLVPANSTISLPDIKGLVLYDYILSVQTEASTLTLHSLGTFSSNPGELFLQVFCAS